MDTWDRPCVNCSVDLPNGGSWINGKGPLCSACSINTMRLLNGGQARFEVSEIIALRAEIARLQAELAEARKDSARLDAVQRENWTVHYCSMLSRWELLIDHAHPAHRKTYIGKTARAAIDAERKGEQDAK